jgi:hypothetical protein
MDEVTIFAEKIGASNAPPVAKQFLHGRNLFFINNNVLVIKISRSKRPFWGINKDYKDFLHFLILLISENSGYIYSKREVDQKIKSLEWNLQASDNNYKINYNDGFYRNKFSSPEECLAKMNSYKM